MQERSITRAVALADIATIRPAVMEIERDGLALFTFLRVVHPIAVVLAGPLVAVDHLRWLCYHSERWKSISQDT